MIYKMNRDDYDYLLVSASDGIWDALSVTDLRDYLLAHSR